MMISTPMKKGMLLKYVHHLSQCFNFQYLKNILKKKQKTGAAPHNYDLI